jgi:anti-sigma factor RsiW
LALGLKYLFLLLEIAVLDAQVSLFASSAFELAFLGAIAGGFFVDVIEDGEVIGVSAEEQLQLRALRIKNRNL